MTAGKRLGRPCCVQECERVVDKTGGYDMCGMHYQRYRKHGSPQTVKRGGASMPLEQNPNWSEVPSYTAVHLRLRRHQGSAKNKLCVDCGRRAAHWSYDNADPDELIDPGLGRYSRHLCHYQPRCVPCHSTFDRTHALLTGERP